MGLWTVGGFGSFHTTPGKNDTKHGGGNPDKHFQAATTRLLLVGLVQQHAHVLADGCVPLKEPQSRNQRLEYWEGQRGWFCYQPVAPKPTSVLLLSFSHKFSSSQSQPGKLSHSPLGACTVDGVGQGQAPSAR